MIKENTIEMQEQRKQMADAFLEKELMTSIISAESMESRRSDLYRDFSIYESKSTQEIICTDISNVNRTYSSDEME